MATQILIGDCREKLRGLADASVHCVVTSPPYFGLRDYGHAGQMGLEPTPEEFVAVMVEVFREVRRVLRDDGTLWLNIGDSYSTAGGPGWQGKNGERSNRRFTGTRNTVAMREQARTAYQGSKPKDLIGIPWLLAFALRADGWFLRQDIIWSKPNPMPESVRDRCTKAHEYLFLMTKSPRYFYDADAIAEPLAVASISRLTQDVESQAGSDRVPGKTNGPMKAVRKRADRFGGNKHNGATTKHSDGSIYEGGTSRNKRSVWEVATQPFSEAHFATYPPALIEPCILAGCPALSCPQCGAPVMRQVERTAMVIDRSERTHDKGQTRSSGKMVSPAASKTTGFKPSCACDVFPYLPGVVLDPFFGAGTTGLVADRLQRDCIGIELNPEYAALAERRIADEAGLFGEVEAA